MGSDSAENFFCPALTSKNALLAVSQGGAVAWAGCFIHRDGRLSGVEPHARLKASLKGSAAGQPNDHIGNSPPYIFKLSSS